MSPISTVSFYGVRGSTPCSCSSMSRYGGNTSCVVVERADEAPFILDIGTGLRFYGLASGGETFSGTLLVSHLHWDHVQGLPFFPQILHPDSEVTVLGPPEEDRSFDEAFNGFVQPPYFPIRLTDLPGNITFDDFSDTTRTIGTAQVMAQPVPHNGNTNGYRIEWDDFAVAYIPDHQEPDDPTFVPDSVLRLVDGVDLLIHDAQFTPELLKSRKDWGHCTPEYASEVARQGSVKELALFHHDPLHDDEFMDELERNVSAKDHAFKVFCAAEGMKLSY